MANQDSLEDTSDFAAMLAEYEQRGGSKKKSRGPSLVVGAEVRGRVVAMSRDAVFVDLGGKDDGVLAIDELRGPDGTVTVQIGDEIQARVVEIEGRSGGVVLRRMLGRGVPQGSAELRQAFELRIPVEGHVTGVVKGGVEVQVAGARAFCPISQLDLKHVEDANSFVGQRLQFQITRFEEGRSLNLVLSRRILLEVEAKQRAAELRKKLVVGAVLHGKVTALKDYGAFVDLGGLEGMLHVSELSFQRARHPQDVLSIGQELEVQVIKLEPSDDPRKPEKIALSLKSLEPDPWINIETRYMAGMQVSGTVRRTESFGAFVELEPGVEGLLHIGELAGGGAGNSGSARLRHAKDAVQAGQKIDVVVKSVDPEKRRLSLELLATQAARQEEAGAKAVLAAQVPARFGTLGDLLAKRPQGKKR
jgi:small subunit ribosomal protein S1